MNPPVFRALRVSPNIRLEIPEDLAIKVREKNLLDLNDPALDKEELQVALVLKGKALQDFKKLFNRSLSCSWEEASDEMRALSDMLTHGTRLPSHRDKMPESSAT